MYNYADIFIVVAVRAALHACVRRLAVRLGVMRDSGAYIPHRFPGWVALPFSSR